MPKAVSPNSLRVNRTVVAPLAVVSKKQPAASPTAAGDGNGERAALARDEDDSFALDSHADEDVNDLIDMISSSNRTSNAMLAPPPKKRGLFEDDSEIESEDLLSGTEMTPAKTVVVAPVKAAATGGLLDSDSDDDGMWSDDEDRLLTAKRRSPVKARPTSGTAAAIRAPPPRQPAVPVPAARAAPRSGAAPAASGTQELSEVELNAAASSKRRLEPLAAAAASQATKRPCVQQVKVLGRLIPLGGTAENKTAFTLEPNSVLSFGRNSGCAAGCRFTNTFVSNQHCRISVNASGGVVLEDLRCVIQLRRCLLSVRCSLMCCAIR